MLPNNVPMGRTLKRPPTAEPLVAGVLLQEEAVVPALQVGPLLDGVVGAAVTTRAKERTAMMDWNCMLAKVGNLIVFGIRKVDGSWKCVVDC